MASLSPLAEQVIEVLAVAGVLTSGQLERICRVRPRTLRKYHGLYYLDRLPLLTRELMERGLSDKPAEVRLYKLGPVGEHIARKLIESATPTGYTGYGTRRIMHDVLANEVAVRLSEFAMSQGYEPIWRSKYAATVHDERGAPALEPDAMLTLKKDGEALHFFIEFHNEDHGRRAQLKVDRYEQVYRDGWWKRELLLAELPVVLAVFSHRIAGRGYQETVNRARRLGLRCTYLGRSWESIVEPGGED
ncbi:MAG: replication-relaxation family protein [Anaerolineales bacterium]